MKASFIGTKNIRYAITTMNFNELPEFKKDCKRLGEKYYSLPKDLERLKKVLETVPLGTDKHFAILYQNDIVKIAKACFLSTAPATVNNGVNNCCLLLVNSNMRAPC